MGYQSTSTALFGVRASVLSSVLGYKGEIQAARQQFHLFEVASDQRVSHANYRHGDMRKGCGRIGKPLKHLRQTRVSPNFWS